MIDDKTIIDFLKELGKVPQGNRLAIFQQYLRSLPEDQVSKAELFYSFMDEFGSEPAIKKKIVVLVHGIRTFATWQGKVEKLLSGFPNVEVVKIKYFYFGLLRFWFPLFTRKKPILRVLRELQTISNQNKDAEIIVVAHSFGSYIIHSILKENSHLEISRLLLCGSVVKEDFDWTMLPVLPSAIVNDVGLKDKLPLLAKLTSWGYGISGSYGFGTYSIKDRYHNVGHSEFFSDEHNIVKNYWIPFLIDGRIIKTELDANQPQPNGMLAWFSSFPQGSLTYFLISIVAYFLYLVFG